MDWSSDENIKITYRLLRIKGYGPAKANKLLWSLKPSIENSKEFEASLYCALKPQEKKEFEDPFELYQDSNERIGYISVLDDLLYPSMLRTSLWHNSPTVLSFMGNVNLLKKEKIGFSGSRKVSERGIWIAGDCVKQLAQDDVCVVSGYAKGVDLIALEAALRNGATSIVVLPEGISNFRIRPELRELWDWNRVLVVSEFTPHARWMVSHAMARNKTIIGLSDMMLVIEAGKTGGSLDAGLKTLQAGKALFVPRFREFPESAFGNLILLRNGAYALGLGRGTHHTNIELIRILMHRRSMELFK